MPHSRLLAGRYRSDRRGSVTVLLVILLPALFLLASYAINIAYIEAVSAEVQITTDAAVQSAGRAYMHTGSQEAALAAAQEAASRNQVSGKTVPIGASDLEFGISLRSSLATGYSFSPVGPNQIGNSVRLTTHTLRNRSVPLFQPIFPTMGVDIEIRPNRSAVSTQSTLDIALVIDRSGSMAFASNEATDPYAAPAAAPEGWWFGDAAPPQSRWLDLVASVASFCDYLDNSPQREKMSLSTYSNSTATDQSLTFDYDLVMNGLDGYTQSFTGGSTAIGLGLQEGHGAINDMTVARPYAVKVMVLMTDGIHNTDISPESVVPSLQSSGVTLFTITFSDEADQQRMKGLAAVCGGEHFHAVNAVQLTDAFRDIARRLPSLMTQ